MAGNIGITPRLSMARNLHGQGAEFELHGCGRWRERMGGGRLQDARQCRRLQSSADDASVMAQDSLSLYRYDPPAHLIRRLRKFVHLDNDQSRASRGAQAGWRSALPAPSAGLPF